jgi:uncharacterized protein
VGLRNNAILARAIAVAIELIVPPFTDPAVAARKSSSRKTSGTRANRTEFFTGRAAIVEFLRRKWNRELDYKLKKELWGFRNNRMAVRFEYEWHDDSGNWFRSYGNELWEFAESGLMRRREASINDQPIPKPTGASCGFVARTLVCSVGFSRRLGCFSPLPDIG